MSKTLWLAGLLVAGAGLRAGLLTTNRFHPDEALYARYGRLIASGQDPWLASVVVDKPPLAYYSVGGSMALFGPTEFAARLPALFASVVSLALLYELGRRLYGQAAGICALVVFALSPFAISFAATVFFDPLQVMFLLWAALAGARGRWGYAGVAAALALAVKQTTLAFLPLLGWLLMGRTRPALLSARRVAAFLLPVVFVALAATAWDASRHAEISFWAQGFTDNAPARMVGVGELRGRLAEIVWLLSYFTAAPLVIIVGAIGLGLLWWEGFEESRNPVFLRRFAGPAGYRVSEKAVRVDLALFTILAAYLGAYWLLAFNLWDRYFLVLVPIFALLAARGALRLARLVRPWAVRWAAPALALAMLPAAITASRSGFPVGGDHGAYDGIDLVARYLAAKPKGSVLYDHWLSWELRYYLDDAPIYLVWMPDGDTLASDLRAFGRSSDRYFVSPSWEDDSAMRRAAQEAGFTFQPVYDTTRRDGSVSFTVYQLTPGGG